MNISEHANYLLNEYGRLQFDYAAYCKPDGESLRNEARNNLETYIAELEEVIEILGDQQRETKNILIDKNLHIDSLYEEGYKLQQRIAELEAAQRWIPVSERLPEEDTDGNTLMAICRHSGEWVRAPFGAEFADEFVRHYSYWMYAPQPPIVYGKVCEE